MHYARVRSRTHVKNKEISLKIQKNREYLLQNMRVHKKKKKIASF